MAVGTGEGAAVVGRTGGEAAAMAGDLSLCVSAVFVDLISGKQTEEEEKKSVGKCVGQQREGGHRPPTEIGQLHFSLLGILQKLKEHVLI
jgi:hypothetical protein